MPKLVAASITIALELYFVPLVSIGLTPSNSFIAVSRCFILTCGCTCRTRTKLVNGQIQVAGDQWPVLLYANYTYDPEDPWNGLLRSGLLISVSSFKFLLG